MESDKSSQNKTKGNITLSSPQISNNNNNNNNKNNETKNNNNNDENEMSEEDDTMPPIDELQNLDPRVFFMEYQIPDTRRIDLGPDFQKYLNDEIKLNYGNIIDSMIMEEDDFDPENDDEEDAELDKSEENENSMMDEQILWEKHRNEIEQREMLTRDRNNYSTILGRIQQRVFTNPSKNYGYNNDDGFIDDRDSVPIPHYQCQQPFKSEEVKQLTPEEKKKLEEKKEKRKLALQKKKTEKMKESKESKDNDEKEEKVNEENNITQQLNQQLITQIFEKMNSKNEREIQGKSFELQTFSSQHNKIELNSQSNNNNNLNKNDTTHMNIDSNNLNENKNEKNNNNSNPSQTKQTLTIHRNKKISFEKSFDLQSFTNPFKSSQSNETKQMNNSKEPNYFDNPNYLYKSSLENNNDKKEEKKPKEPWKIEKIPKKISDFIENKECEIIDLDADDEE